ncbi:MAG: L,D-transpeptidase family protein [Candidatus Contendobacter sp.]|nr:L,D-transpeptidase family protein [Candidatus Contendobacter sp.]
MKSRILPVLVLVLTVIGGGIAIYRWQPPPPPTQVEPPPVKTVADSKLAEKTVPEPPMTSETAETPPSPGNAPDQVALLETPAPPPVAKIPLPTPPAHGIVNRILVEKKARRLTLFRDNKPVKTYAIALGRQPEGHKQFEGDNKTPEGRYVIDSRKKNSSFHRALHISYPNPKDVAFATGQKKSAGGNIMIHGLPNGMGALGPLHRLRDWTAGCIAVTNAEIEEIWRVVPDGTPIEIRP